MPLLMALYSLKRVFGFWFLFCFYFNIAIIKASPPGAFWQSHYWIYLSWIVGLGWLCWTMFFLRAYLIMKQFWNGKNLNGAGWGNNSGLFTFPGMRAPFPRAKLGTIKVMLSDTAMEESKGFWNSGSNCFDSWAEELGELKRWMMFSAPITAFSFCYVM